MLWTQDKFLQIGKYFFTSNCESADITILNMLERFLNSPCDGRLVIRILIKMFNQLPFSMIVFVHYTNRSMISLSLSVIPRFTLILKYLKIYLIKTLLVTNHNFRNLLNGSTKNNAATFLLT